MCSGIVLSEIEGGVVVAPLVFDGAFVVATVGFIRLLKNAIPESGVCVGELTRQKRKVRATVS